MSIQTRRWTQLCLTALAATLLATGVLLLTRRRTSRQVEVLSYTPLTGEASWEGEWELSPRGADPSQTGSLAGTDRVTIPFTGTGLALQVRRGSYRAYFWIRVDGEPANRLPQTDRGAYLVLSSPDYEPETVTIPVAGGLDEGPHRAVVVADRGWDQWPLVGWQVKRGPETLPYDQVLAGLAAGAVTCLAGLIASVTGWQGDRFTGESGNGDERDQSPHSGRFTTFLGSSFSGLCSPVAFLIAAGVFYASPWLPLTLVAGATLVGLTLVRLDLGLAMVALSAPFYLHPRPLLGKSFSMAEILILMCVASWGLRLLTTGRFRRLSPRSLTWADRGVLYLVLIAAAATLLADRRHVALRELRVVVLEPALFYLMLRTTEIREKATWRIVDGFVVGVVLVALIGLLQYTINVNVITAEQGFRRLRSVYGSPNNAALYLGRGLPILLSVTLFAKTRQRRLVYGTLAVPVALALLLTFSRAAILLGIPAGLLTLGVLAGGRWRWIALGIVAAGAVAVVPLLNTPRFAGLLDPSKGTLFFRLQLWRASWKMFLDHPWVGVGPDNFLYQYRGRYILPSAWQEPHLSHAHNLPLTYATRLGIPGLAAGLILYAAFWRQALPVASSTDPDRRALALGLMGSVAYGLGHGLVDASFFFVDLALAFLLGLGLVQSIRRYGANG